MARTAGLAGLFGVVPTLVIKAISKRTRSCAPAQTPHGLGGSSVPKASSDVSEQAAAITIQKAKNAIE